MTNRLRYAILVLALVALSGIAQAGETRPMSASPPPPALVDLDLHFHAHDTKEVSLVWGINGWQPAPAESRPAGTTVKDGKIHTAMEVRDGIFEARLTVPIGTTVDYGFLYTRTGKAGAPVLFEGGPPLRRLQHRTLLDLYSSSPLTDAQQQAWTGGGSPDIETAAVEIRFHAAAAGEVWLLWGVNGWHNAPVAFRPQGTQIRNTLMYSPMQRHGSQFSIVIQVLPGMDVEYGFLISKTDDGTPVQISEYGGDLSSAFSTPEYHIGLPAGTPMVSAEQRASWLSGHNSDLPLITQEIRTRRPDADEAWLTWGVDGWKPVPQQARPSGTAVEEGVMKSLMHREGDVFTAIVKAPAGASINYRFVTKRSSGMRHAGSGGHLPVRLNGRLDVESSVTKAVMAQRKSWPSGHQADSSLISQEIRYRIAGAGEVWLEWGINGWQTVPDEARPPGTVLHDGKIMRTRMVRHGDVYSATVHVPSGMIINYNFLITKTSGGVPLSLRQDSHGQDHWKLVRTSGSLEEKATVCVSTEAQRDDWVAGRTSDLPLVAMEIRYQAPGAGEVWLDWGLEGWRPISDRARPRDTRLVNGRMQTLLFRKGSVFGTKLQIPPCATLEFAFHITRTDEGQPTDIRQDRDRSGRSFTRMVSFDETVEILSTAWVTAAAADSPVVSQEILYRIGGAGEVWLEWGMNGWQPVPPGMRPPGTRLVDGRMHTKMTKKGDTYQTVLRVPTKASLDYRFLIAKTSQGDAIILWDDNEGAGFRKASARPGIRADDTATVCVLSAEQRADWLRGQSADLPLVSEEVVYQAPGAAEVWLQWGIDGWHSAPASQRPAGTVVKNEKMETPLARNGSAFSARLKAPPCSSLNLAFHIRRSDNGLPVDHRQDDDGMGRKLTQFLPFDGRLHVSSTWKAP